MTALSSILDVRFYEKVIILAKNAVVISKKASQSELTTKIYRFHSEAMKNFLNRNYLASILFSSIGVETYLNSDKRLEDYKVSTKYKWITLNLEAIKKARDKGLPVFELLDDSEISLRNTPIFCIRRNKILHGDIEGLTKEGLKKKLPEIEAVEMKMGRDRYLGYFFVGEEAGYDQLLKFQKFCLKL